MLVTALNPHMATRRREIALTATGENLSLKQAALKLGL